MLVTKKNVWGKITLLTNKYARTTRFKSMLALNKHESLTLGLFSLLSFKFEFLFFISLDFLIGCLQHIHIHVNYESRDTFHLFIKRKGINVSWTLNFWNICSCKLKINRLNNISDLFFFLFVYLSSHRSHFSSLYLYIVFLFLCYWPWLGHWFDEKYINYMENVWRYRFVCVSKPFTSLFIIWSQDEGLNIFGAK